jgi:hypothetical protein
MTKAEKRQLELIHVYLDNDMHDTAAKSLSAMIRSTMNDNTKADLFYVAYHFKLRDNENFIV